MCRRYIITGMNKAGKWLFPLLWVLVIVGSRVLYFLYAERTMADTYGFFRLGMERAWESGSGYRAGLGDAYIWTLSWLFRFTGDRIEIVGMYQAALQILWLVLLFTGICILAGKKAGFLISGVLMILPWFLGTIFVVSPENYYMLHFAAFLVILGCFCNRKKTSGKPEPAAVTAESGKPEPALTQTEKETAKEKTQEEEQTQKTETSKNCEEGYVITEDGRKIKLFDNPLPLPPKHVKKTMSFDFNGTKDDFDYQVTDSDDFDV